MIVFHLRKFVIRIERYEVAKLVIYVQHVVFYERLKVTSQIAKRLQARRKRGGDR